MPEYSVWSYPGVVAAILMAAGATGPAPVSSVPKHSAAEGLDGPIAATVERVVDGDTIEVRARIWLGQSIVIRVRLNGVDTPELQARCDAERRMAENARDFLVRRFGGSAEVKLSRVVYDKYGGRVRADVSDREGDISQALLAAGLGRPYHGERRESWCD